MRTTFRSGSRVEADDFFGGRYKGRVITVHSNQTGDEKDKTVQQLLFVEDPAN
jgi:type III restriction enzyme